MFRAFVRHGAVLLLLTLVPASPLTAQEDGDATPSPPQQPQMPDSVQELVTEFRQVQQRVDSIQSEAMEATPELQARRTELQEAVQQKVVEMHPDLEPRMERLESIQSELQEAQESQNQQEVQELVMEAREIQRRLRSAQAEAMQQEDVAQAIQGFQDDLISAMRELDPGVGEKLTRLEELSQRLQAIQVEGGAPGGGS